MEKYRDEWGIPGQQYDCRFRDQEDSKKVIRRINMDDTDMLHMLLWPSVAFFLGMVALITLYCLFGCETMMNDCCRKKKRNQNVNTVPVHYNNHQNNQKM